MAGHVFAASGRCLQVVVKQSNLWQSPTGQSSYNYVEIPNTSKTFTILETGSLLIVEMYHQGWMGSSGSGCDGCIKWNDNLLGRGSSSNGNGWSRNGNGGDSYRSFNTKRTHNIDHGLAAGASITISAYFGAWSSTGATVNYSTSYKAPMIWIASEYSRNI